MKSRLSELHFAYASYSRFSSPGCDIICTLNVWPLEVRQLTVMSGEHAVGSRPQLPTPGCSQTVMDGAWIVIIKSETQEQLVTREINQVCYGTADSLGPVGHPAPYIWCDAAELVASIEA